MSWFTFFGFLGTTEYCRLVRLKLCVNLKETERERESVCGRGEWERKEEEGGKEEGERESHREGNVVGRKGGLGCDQDIECS